jgi:hypothetical protein
VRAVRAGDAGRFLKLPNEPPEVTALCSIVFVDSSRGVWLPALKFSVHDSANTAAEPIAKGRAATTDDGAVSAAEQVFANRAEGMTREESTALVSRAAFRLGQGEARGEVRNLLSKFAGR